MNYLEIKSWGEIDIQAFTLIGASTKRGDLSKIGLYGSGNKYSIATLLKQGIAFKVFSGEDEIVFSTKKQSFRDLDFDVILVNGVETSLTTTMGGSEWANAFAPIREIYSNALDEDKDATLTKTSEIIAERGFTKFFIEMTEDVAHFYKNIHLYFCNENPKVLLSNGTGSVYPNTDSGNVRIFRKGILAHFSDKKKALYHYNFIDIDINESRVLQYIWQVNTRVGSIFKKCQDEALINTLLMNLEGANSGYLEHEADWEGYHNFSNSWWEACKDKVFAPIEFLEMFEDADLKGAYKLPMKLLKALKSQFTDLKVLGISATSNEMFVIAKPSQILTDKIIDAVALLNSTRYKHRFDNPTIECVKFSAENVYGLANAGKIYLSTKLASEDINKIAKIIIEENEHNLSGLGDETRNFQNHLFSLYFDELTK